ncbi:unnamed protein product [Effrenium voratum]|nr:unnamed protein product [Effrenium voratum]
MRLQGMGTLPLLVVDEAAQVVEPGPWVPLSHGCQRLVLVGDEKQLPATIHHPLAFQRGLGISMFERFVRDGLVRMGNGFVQLDEQRRMHPSIAQFPSLAFYDGTVHDALETKQRQPVPGFPWPNPEYHVAFVECGFCEGEERRRSHANPREADVLLEVLSWCLSAGMKPCQIGVITGYSAQQEMLQQRVAQLAKRLVFDPAELRVDTVDGFQGAERDLILASTVRSFSRVGFMRDPRRANVMLTRARRGLVVFGNGETLQTEEDTWKPWISWVRERGIELKAEVILPVEAGNDPGEPFTTPDLQSEVRSKWPPAWPAEATKPAPESVPADRTSGAQSSALDWLAASEPCWPEVKVVPVPAQDPVPQEPEAIPEPRVEPRQPEELPEKLLEPSQPAEVWTEWVDPETGKLWLYNEVTGEAKWKD